MTVKMTKKRVGFIALSILAAQATGALVYSPLLFIKVWAEAQGKTPETLGPITATPFVVGIIANTVAAFLLVNIAAGMKISRAAQRAVLGGLLGVGLVALGQMTHYLFLGIDPVVGVIDGLASTLSMILISVIAGIGLNQENS